MSLNGIAEPAPPSTKADASLTESDLRREQSAVRVACRNGISPLASVVSMPGSTQIADANATLTIAEGPTGHSVWWAKHGTDTKTNGQLREAASREFGSGNELSRALNSAERNYFQATGKLPSDAQTRTATLSEQERMLEVSAARVASQAGISKTSNVYTGEGHVRIDDGKASLDVVAGPGCRNLWFAKHGQGEQQNSELQKAASFEYGSHNQLARELNRAEITEFQKSGRVPDNVYQAEKSTEMPKVPAPTLTPEQAAEERMFSELKKATTAAGMSKNAWAVSPRPGVYMVQDAVSEVEVNVENGTPKWNATSTNPSVGTHLNSNLGKLLGPENEMRAGLAAQGPSTAAPAGATAASPPVAPALTTNAATPEKNPDTAASPAATSSKGAPSTSTPGKGVGGMLSRAGKGVWNYVKNHPIETALTVAAVAGAVVTAPASGTALLGAAGLRIAGGLVGKSLLRRGLAGSTMAAGRFIGRGLGSRALGRMCTRGALRFMANVPGMAADFLGSAAKGVKSLANNLGSIAGGALGVLKGGGGMSTVMSGSGHQTEAGSEGFSLNSPAEQQQDPSLPGRRNAKAMSRAARARSGPAPSVPTKADMMPDR